MTPPNAAILPQTKSYAPPLWLDASVSATSTAPADLRDAYALIEAQRRRIEELEDLATKDELTGLSNRRGLLTAFNLENERIARGQSPGAVMVLIDLNGFKGINDTFGHEAGDAALRALSTTLLGFIRTTDHVARLGGDEFVVLLSHTTQSQMNRRLSMLDQFINSLTLEWKGRRLSLSAALGSALLDGRTGLTGVLEIADTAMYLAKNPSKSVKARVSSRAASHATGQRAAASSTPSERITA